eukprot:TRINITY_DN26538_c0_g1_i1.p1 TRINITY_DN26538_c0_g1~~TRINITY_DN26538_c0_g1_i1.p1  ORF type:complete len:221 (-),score=39.06 TRINITY_DN26538_c0_g1_i1:40-702(-)
MIRRPPRSTLSSSSAASDVYKRQDGAHLVVVLGLGELGGVWSWAVLLALSQQHLDRVEFLLELGALAYAPFPLVEYGEALRTTLVWVSGSLGWIEVCVDFWCGAGRVHREVGGDGRPSVPGRWTPVPFPHLVLVCTDGVDRHPHLLLHYRHLCGHRAKVISVLQRSLPVLCVDTLSLIHISEPTRLLSISYAVFCLKKKKKKAKKQTNNSNYLNKKTKHK